MAIKQRQNIVMIGNPGSGKTHLSIALGMNACEAGYRVKFYTAVNLAAELAEAVQMNRLSKLEKSLSKIDLLIIDELSYLTFNRYQSEMLFQIISERSERASCKQYNKTYRNPPKGMYRNPPKSVQVLAMKCTTAPIMI